MEVITLTGGFRGLGLTSSSEQERLLRWLNDSIQPAAMTIDRVRTADSHGQLPTASAQRLENLWTALAAEHSALVEALPDEIDLPAWQQRARAMLAHAAAFTADARAVLGDEASGRGLRLALLAAGSVAVLGGIAWVIYRYGKRRHPGSRGRRRR